MSEARVGVLMGSLSDFDIMVETVRTLDGYGVRCDVRVLSAHRTPDAVAEYCQSAADRGLRMIVAGAGGAAHLAGAVAAHTPLPVIGVPLEASSMAGMDALLATVQMPSGVPVATMGVGKWGARNAGHLAARILALDDPEVAAALERDRAGQLDRVERMGEELRERLEDEGLA